MTPDDPRSGLGTLLRLFPLSALLMFAGCASDDAAEVEPAAEAGVAFDSALAARLGADQYGMRSYVVAFLRAGPNRDLDSATAAQLQRGHLDNIFRLADEGTLILSGPFIDGGSLRGIYIFDVSSLDEARTLTETDPAIEQGFLEMELRPWYGSAALREVYGIHRRISRETP